MALMSSAPPSAPTVPPLKPGVVQLSIRQQPKEALITTEGKEKARKPVDPPPILELTVSPNADPQQQFLQSPYLFLTVSLFRADRDEPHDAKGEKSLSGTLVSSLHRLKDVNNKDGGFFVFGDISVKVAGKFRLHFSLYEFQNSSSEVMFLGSISSDAFSVLLPKDFKGMEESTYLSRAFSDQGVRLRLRKEPRGLMAGKRGYPYEDEQQQTPIRPNLQSEYSGSYDETSSPNKRFKSEGGDRKDSFPESASATMSQYSQLYTPTATYSASSYATPRQTHLVSAPAADYNHLGMHSQYASVQSNMSNAYSGRSSYPKSASSNVYASPSVHDATNGSTQYALPQQTTFPGLYPYPQSSSAAPAVDFAGFSGDTFKTDMRYTHN